MTLTATKPAALPRILAEVARGRAAVEPAFLRSLRQAARARFEELGLPTARNEDWKFTNVSHLGGLSFTDHHNGMPDRAALRHALVRAGEAYQLTFVDGRLARDLSTLPANGAGFTLTSLGEALGACPNLVEKHLGTLADSRQQVFTALNMAGLTDGAFFHLPRGRQVDRPIYVTSITSPSTEPTLVQLRNVIVLEEGSEATVVETAIGLGDHQYWQNTVTEAHVGPNASLDHYRVQREGRRAIHMGNLYVALERASRSSSQLVSLGGALVRNEAHAVFLDEGGECTLNGLYLGTGSQHIDNHTVIDHAKPHCASHELFKGILDGRASGVFNGKIFVRQDAQKTDAKQTNQTLLLSDDATINTKPQLEIFADDVKCTHGATVGNLEEEAIFYLRSRGIDLQAARGLLTFAFANDIIDRIKVEPIRAELENLLLTAQHLPREQVAQEAV